MKNTLQILGIMLFILSLSMTAYGQHVAIANAKMNVVYIGVENPMEIAVSGYAAEAIRVKVEQGTISGENGKYNWAVTTPGTATISVNVNENGKEREVYSMQYRVKRIPDPIAKVGDGNQVMTVGYVQAQTGVQAILENFDFDASCEVESFVMTVVRPQADPVDVNNNGGDFEAAAKRLITMLAPGSIIYIENIKSKCLGDIAVRKINSLVIKVK
jgi:hypothetical protein